MKTFIFLCCVVAIAIATPTTLELRSKWTEFKLAYNKTYANANEEKKRMEIFAENVKKIEEHNKLYEQGLTTYKMGVNQFTDWTQEEFVAYLTKHKGAEQKSLFTFQKPLNADLPDSLDWRNNGSVSPIKDQGLCGSCWAFSATGSLESQIAIRKGQLVLLSEQELVDCSRILNSGCNGGWAQVAYEYVRDNGLTTEQEYPYEGIDNKCRRGNKTEAVRTSGYVAIPSGDESSLLSAVATVGPISVAVDATNWSTYSGGIFIAACKKDMHSLNHAVLAVGYGIDRDGHEYWLIKNSWGNSWGEDGYIRLPRNQNYCGVATEASYPLLA